MISLSLENPIFRSYAFYAGLSILKMFVCTFLIVYTRMTKGVFANKEDVESVKGKKPVTFNDEDVERLRRNHLNDVENIIPFILIGGLYVAINPSYTAALWHFRIFFFSRLIHFISYQLHLQPSRAISFAIGVLSTMSMTWSVISATM